MSEVTVNSVNVPSSGVTSKKKQTSSSEPNQAITWKSLSIREKWTFLTSNITVEPMAACYIISIVFSGLATQNLILEKACRVNLAYSDEVCTALSERNTTGYEAEEIAVQQLIARMQTWRIPLQCALPSILILFMGAWSDRSGLRKPCMLVPIVGEFLSSITLIGLTYWFYELPMEMVVLEGLWPSLAGGSATMFLGIFSYIADITSVESRTLRIGAVNVFISLGVPIGTSLSGIMYRKLGFYGIYSISAVCYILSFVYGLVVIKEPPKVIMEQPREKMLTNENKRTSLCASILNFFSLSHIKETFQVAFKKGAQNRQKRVTVLMVITMVIIGPFHGEFAVAYFYMRYRYKWNEVQYSMFSTFCVVTNIIGTSFSVGIFSHILKIDDAVVGIMSCMSKILGGFVYAFAISDWMVYLAAVVEIINGTSFIAMRSTASKLVPTDELGKVNSLFGVCEALMPLVYGPMYSAIYAATMNTFPGTFWIAGSCMTMPAILGFVWLYTEHRKDRRVLKEQKEYETVTNHRKSEDTGNGLKNLQIIDSQKNIQKAEKMNGINNTAFESELM